MSTLVVSDTVCEGRAMGENGQDRQIDRNFVDHWAARYPMGSEEVALFGEVRRGVAGRGHYERVDFLRAGTWKSARPKPYLESNSDDDIRDLTRLAFVAPERLGYRILDLLSGVNVRMASALLTVWAPDRFTVIDFRALETLRARSELSGPDPTYPEYLALCRTIAARVGTDLRTLDRALWTWSREEGKAKPPDDTEPIG
ncbi:hypothetical protein [Actinomycetospora sp. CA-084318]|uniref:hypothetical protein n=1 Tax=Actinomycetospora sp. CA-084318 TaxID=3239892 RepID=UPI003D951544